MARMYIAINPILFNQCQKLANEKYDGHFTLLLFTTNVRAGFGTPYGREDYDKVPGFTTINKALKNALNHEPTF